MRKRTLRRVNVLEEDERSRELEQQSSLTTISFFCWKTVLAYYVGGLKPDEDPGEAAARALNYESSDDYVQALFDGDIPEISQRFNDAARRLFAQAGLDFDRGPPSALSEAFVRMVNQLPEQWLKWLRSELRPYCPTIEIGAGSNVALPLSDDALFVWGDLLQSGHVLGDDKASRNSRVFTQTSDLCRGSAPPYPSPLADCCADSRGGRLLLQFHIEACDAQKSRASERPKP